MKTKDTKQNLTMLSIADIECVSGGKKLSEHLHQATDFAKDIAYFATYTFGTVVAGIGTIAVFVNADNVLQKNNGN